ncbi:MAG: hypothetical protein ABJA60_06005, partial [Nitrosospira sp.]
MQSPVEKVFGAGDNNYRQVLRSSPVQDGLEWNYIVLLTVNDEDAGVVFDAGLSNGVDNGRDVQSFNRRTTLPGITKRA